VPFNANEPSKSEFDISTVDTMVRAVESLIAAQK
jgi:acyl carrier protein